eukprot:3940780-Rhodomonas_salina.4
MCGQAWSRVLRASAVSGDNVRGDPAHEHLRHPVQPRDMGGTDTDTDRQRHRQTQTHRDTHM